MGPSIEIAMAVVFIWYVHATWTDYASFPPFTVAYTICSDTGVLALQGSDLRNWPR